MKRGSGERGQAILEFAFAAAVFLIIFFGVVDFGQAYYENDRVAQAARLGARYAIANTIPPASDCGTNSPTAACLKPIIGYITSKSGLDPAKLTVAITFGGTSVDQSYPTCSSNPTVGCWVNVELRYPFNFVALNFLSKTLVSSSRMVITAQY